jgi:hypothetical protein
VLPCNTNIDITYHDRGESSALLDADKIDDRRLGDLSSVLSRGVDAVKGAPLGRWDDGVEDEDGFGVFSYEHCRLFSRHATQTGRSPEHLHRARRQLLQER